ncbi:MAG: hypothetical protein GOV00_02790 [Candidatus Altiarchaeota archaeon]|nr:hypothetical protein [Candidatus Altiarchaeota archaeon]
MLSAVALAISTTIGAGVLALPMAFFESGPVGLIISSVIAIFLILSGAMVSDLLREKKGPIQIPALISDIIGKRWKVLIYLTLIFSMYGALSAYLIGFGRQLAVLFPIEPIVGSLAFYLFGTYVVFRGTKIIAKIDTPMAILLVSFLIVISIVNMSNFSGVSFEPAEGVEGLGVIAGTMLFALFGVNIIPEINYLSKGRGLEAYSISTAICILLYLAFSFSTIGVMGSRMTDLGTEGLAIHYGGLFEIFISLFTLLALLTSFLGIGLCTQHIYNYDFKIPRKLATVLTTVPALLIYLASFFLGFSFLDILAVAGELTLPILLMLISYAYYKATKNGTKSRLPFPQITAVLVGLFYFAIFSSFFLRIIL